MRGSDGAQAQDGESGTDQGFHRKDASKHSICHGLLLRPRIAPASLHSLRRSVRSTIAPRSPLLTREWTSEAVGGGPIGSPVLSADGATVYVNGRDEHLWAINTADGKPKWSVPLNYLAQTPPSVSPEGLIIAGGGPEQAGCSPRCGDHGEVLWTRDDVAPLSASSQAGAGVGYTVVRDGENGLALTVFDPADGHTINSYPLPQASGWPVGVSIGHDRRVVTATSAGRSTDSRPQ